MPTPPTSPELLSSTKPAVQSISADELQAELKGGNTRPAKREASPNPDGGEHRSGDEKGATENIFKGFAEKANAKIAEKTAALEQGDGEKKEAPPEKKPAKTTEKKEAPRKEEPAKPEDKTVEKKEPEAKPTKTDDEIDAELEAVGKDPNMSPRTKVRFDEILGQNKKYREQAKLAAKELTELKSKPLDPTATDQYKALQTEHEALKGETAQYRRRFDLDSDPEFKAKYDDQISQAETAIEATWKGAGLDDATLAAIKKEGGFGAFARSRATFPFKVTDADGNTKTIQRPASEFARDWLAAINPADAEKIRGLMGKQGVLSEEKTAAVKREVEGAKEFFAKRGAESAKANEASIAKTKEMEQQAATISKEITENTDWLKDRAIPDDASADQKKEIEEYNKFTGQLRDGLTKHPTTVKEYFDIALGNAHSHHLRRELGAKEAEIARLTAEVAKAKSGLRTTPAKGSLLTPGKENPGKKESNLDPTDFKGAFRQAIRERSGNAESD